jgi:thiol peroxidase
MTVTFKWEPVSLSWSFPAIWDKAPWFELVDTDLNTHSLQSFQWSRCVLNIFPSIDTEICATSVLTFSKELQTFEDVKLLCISRDLPFAQKKFFIDNAINNALWLSDFRTWSFGKDYGVTITNWPLQWLLARCVLVIDKSWTVIHTQIVDDISTQPKYSTVLQILS